MLRSSDIRMSEHFANAFDRYAVCQGNSCCEGVPGDMISQFFIYAT